eukprot:5672497-Lingulodinium_polyedra.AAC.1
MLRVPARAAAWKQRTPCASRPLGMRRVAPTREARYKQALVWSTYREQFWSSSAHAYIDSKKFA